MSYQIVKKITKEEYKNIVKDRQDFLTKIEEFVDGDIIYMKVSYLTCIMTIIDIVQWGMFTCDRSNGISFTRAYLYISKYLPSETKMINAIPSLVSIRCRFAHSDYSDIDGLFTDAIRYFDIVKDMYNKIDLILSRRTQEVVIDMYES